MISNTKLYAGKSPAELIQRIEKIDHLLETEGKEWFARFDCESGTYKQIVELEEEKELLKKLLKIDDSMSQDVEIEEFEGGEMI